MANEKYSIENDFVVMSPDKTAHIEVFNAELYQRLNKLYGGFKGHDLISCHEFSESWPSWEVHPHGDEVVILLAGEVTFVLETEDGEKSVSLAEPGEYVIVPRNMWHTAKTNTKTRMLFVTPGEGTRHREA